MFFQNQQAASNWTNDTKLNSQTRNFLNSDNSHICNVHAGTKSINLALAKTKIQCVAFAKLLYILYFYRYELFG